MTYPGDGYKMSSYGQKLYTPEQMKEQHKERVDREFKITKNHTATKTARENSPVTYPPAVPINYFNNKKTYSPPYTYDRTFHVTEGYHMKLKRDDLEYTQGLDIHTEEAAKEVPVLSSSVYGRRQSLEHPDGKNVRVNTVKSEFFRAGGTNIGVTD